MAGVNQTGSAGAGIDGEALNASARAQYAAMGRLRWQMFKNGLSRRMGAFELGARTVTFVFYAFMGLGLGTGMGVGAYAIASYDKWLLLPIVFWASSFLWVMVPVMLASFQEQFDLGILLRFPVSFGSYYLLYVIFGLADVSTIIGSLCCMGIWLGITIARPELFAWTALGLVVFAVFNVLLVRAIFAWIDRWLSQRKTREIAGVVFMVLILSLQLLNPALRQRWHSGHMNSQQRAENIRRMKAEYGPWVKSANAVQEWLPPGLAARVLQQAEKAQTAPGLIALGGLGLWVLAAGGVLARRLRAEYRGEDLGSAPSRAKAAASRAAPGRREGGWRFGGSIVALIEKEARSLTRTLPLMWALCAPLLMVLVLASGFRGGRGLVFALPMCVVMALLGFTQLFYNNLGAEGAGIQLLFLSPTPIHRVILAKNLFHSLLFCLDALLAGILASLRTGWPSNVMAADTAAWVLFALPCSLIAGNIISLKIPHRINPGRVARQRGSQASALASMLAQLAMVIVGASVFALCWALDDLWLAVPIFLILATIAVFVWQRVLGNVDALANQNKDALIATLMKES